MAFVLALTIHIYTLVGRMALISRHCSLYIYVQVNGHYFVIRALASYLIRGRASDDPMVSAQRGTGS
jgi:hypothetical protein